MVNYCRPEQKQEGWEEDKEEVEERGDEWVDEGKE